MDSLRFCRSGGDAKAFFILGMVGRRVNFDFFTE
jgi:hypothetical protein